MSQLRFALLWVLAIPLVLLFAALALIAARLSASPNPGAPDSTTIA